MEGAAAARPDDAIGIDRAREEEELVGDKAGRPDPGRAAEGGQKRTAEHRLDGEEQRGSDKNGKGEAEHGEEE